MTVEAARIQYVEQFVSAFENRMSVFRTMTTKEIMKQGLQATFLVSGSGGDTAVTRGVNGQIPYGNPTNTQYTATLAEKHAPYELTNFNVFASQGNQLQIMQMNSMAVINRDIDLVCLAELANSTIDTGTAATASVAMVQKSLGYLGNQGVPIEEEENMFAVITPGFRSYLMQTTEFTNGLYVDVKPFNSPPRKMWRWSGINWAVSPQITGLGTTLELCYLFHRNALGYACNIGEDSIDIGYDSKQATSWSRATIYHAAKVLQNTGIVQMKHDGSAFALS